MDYLPHQAFAKGVFKLLSNLTRLCLCTSNQSSSALHYVATSVCLLALNSTENLKLAALNVCNVFEISFKIDTIITKILFN